MREQQSYHGLTGDVSRRMDRLSLVDRPISVQEDFSSDEGESRNPRSCLIFEYLERDPPYGREPLADKVSGTRQLLVVAVVLIREQKSTLLCRHVNVLIYSFYADIRSCLSCS